MKKLWGWVALLFIGCLTMVCFAAEKDADEDVIPLPNPVKLKSDNADGPITAKELQIYRQYIENITIPKDNHDRSLAWTYSRVVKSLGIIYGMTGDEWYLGQMIKMSDQILSIRNDPTTGVVDYVTGRRLPTWPNYIDRFKAKGKKVYYSNDVQTGMILDAIAHTAYLIMTHPSVYWHEAAFGESYLPRSGVTYLAKAQFYLERCQETIGAFIDFDDLFDQKTQLFRFPDNPRMNEVIPASRGLASAYNRMFAMGRAMLEVAEALKVSDPILNGDTVHRYYRIITAMIKYWRTGVESRKVDQALCYLWYYRFSGRAAAPRYEDIGHLGIDVQCLLAFYRLGEDHLGITEDDLRAIANTYLHIMRIPGTNDFVNPMNGENRPKHSASKNSLINSDKKVFRAIGLTLVEPEMYRACVGQLGKVTSFQMADDFAEFLYWRDRRFRGSGK